MSDLTSRVVSEKEAANCSPANVFLYQTAVTPSLPSPLTILYGAHEWR